MRAMLGVALLFVLGCHQSGLPAAGGAAGPFDLAMSAPVGRGMADFAAAPLDLASSCHYATPNASTSLAGYALGYGWVGNGDGGGESFCGGPPEIAIIKLQDSDTYNDESPQRTSIAATLPLTLGPQAVTVYTTIGGERTAAGTLDVTAFTHTSDGIGIESVNGSIDAPTLQLSGSFAADHCHALDVICI
jgi:hypothetical protein